MAMMSICRRKGPYLWIVGSLITYQEFARAYQLPMPHFVLADYRVEFAHKFLNLVHQDLSKIPDYTTRVEKAEDGREIEVRGDL